MEHQMKLWKGPWEAMAAGTKTVELRLLDEKRRLVKAGDTILFTCSETGEVLHTEVTDVREFMDFRALYEAYDPIAMGYLPGEPVDPAHMEAYYPKEKQEKYGVVAISLRRIQRK